MEQIIKEMCWRKLDELFGDNVPPKIRERLEYELEIIKLGGFFRQYYDACTFCDQVRNAGFLIAPGFGDCTGSLVAYLCEITEINPLEYGLLFECFINQGRMIEPTFQIAIEPQGHSAFCRQAMELSIELHISPELNELVNHPRKNCKIPMNNKKTLTNLGCNKIFIDSAEAAQIWSKCKIERLTDVAALWALCRPGPIRFGQEFIKNKRHPESIQYLHPLQKDVLEETYGFMIYREHIIKNISILTGLPFWEADLIRRAISSCKQADIDLAHQKFIAGCRNKNNISEDLAEKLWDDISIWSRYGFSKAHAIAFAWLQYKITYLKIHAK
ncbi:MAG: hypothetical protein WC071_08670 [Victivallaceae bacterium]